MIDLVPLLSGILLGFLTSGIAMLVGLDRDRATGPVTLIAIAVFYIVFAIECGTGLVTQTLVATGFIAAALVSYRTTLWITVAGLVVHGAFDVLAHALEGPAPHWWAGFCLGIDLVFAVAFAFWIVGGRLSARALDDP